MTLGDLIMRVRIEANDNVAPYFWADSTVVDWLNDAVNEACVRGRLLHESQEPAVCDIAVTAGTSVYPLHPALYELTHLRFVPADGSPTVSLVLASTEQLDAFVPEWRDQSGTPRQVVQGDQDLRLTPTPSQDGVLKLEGYRLPLNPMSLTRTDTDSPELHTEHHRHLILWALHKGFAIPDMEAFDANRSAQAEAAFTAYFGARPDADLRRITREDVPHHVEAFWV